MCINVLDHTYAPKDIVRNAFRYLAEGGQFLLAVDLHSHHEAGMMHPVHLSREIVRRFLSTAGFALARVARPLGLAPAPEEAAGDVPGAQATRRPGRAQATVERDPVRASRLAPSRTSATNVRYSPVFSNCGDLPRVSTTPVPFLPRVLTGMC